MPLARRRKEISSGTLFLRPRSFRPAPDLVCTPLGLGTFSNMCLMDGLQQMIFDWSVTSYCVASTAWVSLTLWLASIKRACLFLFYLCLNVSFTRCAKQNLWVQSARHWSIDASHCVDWHSNQVGLRCWAFLNNKAINVGKEKLIRLQVAVLTLVLCLPSRRHIPSHYIPHAAFSDWSTKCRTYDGLHFIPRVQG